MALLINDECIACLRQSEADRRTVAEYLYKRNHPGDRQTVADMGFEFKDK